MSTPKRQCVRIAELSDVCGVSVSTLKFYLREGLLHPGATRAVNQADYDESHVRRVRLVRALLELGNVQLADIRRVLAAVDDAELPIHEAFGVAQDAMVPRRERDSEEYQRAYADVDAFVTRHGLRVRPDAEARGMLADSLVAMRSAGFDVAVHGFDEQVPGILASSAMELSLLPTDDRVQQMEFSVVGTISYEVAVAAIRRLALEHASWERFGEK
ncbi:MAG: MerR family transcriptional regulator [Trueperaceae bacterium]|nr:MerR family transcriptional regulator [Trueperaceae bacterium]